jgi:hypothetical protein
VTASDELYREASNRIIAMGLKAFFWWLFGKKSGSLAQGDPSSPAAVHTIHHNVDFPTFCGSLKPGSVAYMEFLTVSPWWDGTEVPQAPGEFTIPPTGSYAVAVVDVATTGLSGGRHQFVSVFYANDERRSTKRWSAEPAERGKHIRAVFMVPCEALRGETKVVEVIA